MSKNHKEKNNIGRLEHWQWITLYMMIYDVFAVCFAYFAALWLRHDLKFSLIPGYYVDSWLKFAPLYVLVCIVVFKLCKLYNSIWRFASFKELQRVIVATIITTAFHTIAVTVLYARMPVSYYIIGAFLQFVLISGMRFSYRFVLLLRSLNRSNEANNCMIIGAGAAGTVILRELRRAPALNDNVVCIVDDNPNKWGRDIDGVPIISGGRHAIPSAVKEYNIRNIYVAIPSVSNVERKKILDICKETGCGIKILPGMYELALGKVTVNTLRKVEVEDLLGREPVKMNSREVIDSLQDKVVLVTGGGGSIGSEICRQVAATKNVKQLIVFDIYENNAHAIKLELSDKYPDLDLVVLIGSVRNSRRVKEIFADYRPDIVFHAAAHKHVPLMEDSPCEAIKNNVIGTYYTAFAAMAYGCEKFVLISTDKAVNPVNIMGASKRLCEMIVQTFARMIEQERASELPDLHAHTGTNRMQRDCIVIPDHPNTQFVAVRFGNVLGSNGSVIPRFREQIAKGGPVTVTHPDIIRYFMTIPEASSLVLTASTYGGSGNIFVLDMGTAVKIDDLARNMISLSGLKPDVDIKIEYTGLRPGEKLFEERLMDEEGLERTKNDLINIGKPLQFNEDEFIRQISSLMEYAYEDRKDIRNLVASIVSTYHPAGEKGTEEKSAAYKEQMEEIKRRTMER